MDPQVITYGEPLVLDGFQILEADSWPGGFRILDVSNCYSIFSDGFWTGDTSRWSATVE